ncbi:phage tail protein [Methylogaea oryzae]|uniref:Tail protein n=1 Tax=Methylogaea oryzae TaxID=1295382 RepID=A0A8D5AFR3_9GAMM|nr:tail fiber protein [Methylogaea oryzae]BBL69583.1 tail protein [Methylogaea oryzae]
MADSFTGEVRILPYTYTPMDWALCNGQQMPINQYQALYAVIGAAYGGDGQNYFNLPNLQGQVPMGTGTGPGLTPRLIGKRVGAETVTLTTGEMAAHTHTVTTKTVGPAGFGSMLGTPASDSWLARPVSISASGNVPYSAYTASGVPDVTLAAQTFGAAGGAPVQPHENRQPYLPLRFCISLNGNFPVRPA